MLGYFDSSIFNLLQRPVNFWCRVNVDIFFVCVRGRKQDARCVSLVHSQEMQGEGYPSSLNTKAKPTLLLRVRGYCLREGFGIVYKGTFEKAALRGKKWNNKKHYTMSFRQFPNSFLSLKNWIELIFQATFQTNVAFWRKGGFHWHP